MLTPRGPARPANDNGRALGELMAEPAMMRAALLHFASHGLAAADRARDLAEVAHEEGREGDYRHWLAVCRMLDRRLAVHLEKSAVIRLR